MTEPKQIALYRHWCRANAIRYVLFKERSEVSPTPDKLTQTAELFSRILRLEVFYALVYVVIEGYKELGCKYDKVDTLLEQSEYVERLRRFRNAVFHYQDDLINQKMLEFVDTPDSENWLKNLNEAFQQFFLDTLPLKEQLVRMGWKNT